MSLPIRLKFQFTLDDMRDFAGIQRPRADCAGEAEPCISARSCWAAALCGHGSENRMPIIWLLIPVLLFVMLVVIPSVARRQGEARGDQRQLADHDETSNTRLTSGTWYPCAANGAKPASEWERFTKIIQTTGGFFCLYQGRRVLSGCRRAPLVRRETFRTLRSWPEKDQRFQGPWSDRPLDDAVRANDGQGRNYELD